MPKLLVACLCMLFFLPVIAQDFSNKGKDFFIAYPAHIDGTSSVMGIYITSDVNTSGTIQVGPTATIPFTVTANQVTRKFLGSSGVVDASNSYVYLSQVDGIKGNAAIRITADKPVVAYTHIIRSARSAATLALPTTVLGTEYIAPSYQNLGSSAGYGEIAVVATQPGTVIEVTPTVTGRGGRAANVPFQVTLASVGDVYQFQGINNADISGTRVKSISTGSAGCKPIAVFSATTWSAFDCTNAAGGDNLYQQLFPVRTWGKKFITAPFINRPYDIYRIFVSDPTTAVSATIQGVPFPLNASNYVASGGYYQVKTPYPIYIEADKPISVVQYIVSQTCKSGCSTGSGTTSSCMADPEMVMLNPIEQTLSDITFFSAHQSYVPPNQTQVTQHFVNVIINKAYKSTVKIDNVPVPAFQFIDILNTPYAYLQYDVSASSATNPVHRITADTSFSAIVYGYGNVESYGYNGGTNVRDLYQYVTLQNQYATVNFPATCKNTPFNFSITLPYLATSLTWDFNNNPNLAPNNNVVNNAPVPDSSFVRDGRTLYVYKLPSTTYHFSATGTYNVKVLANNPSPDGCSGVQEINYDVEVYDPPVSDFTVTHSGCFTDSIRFAGSTASNGRPMNKWLWNFGDNTTDTVRTPAKLYQAAGTYNVSLRSISDIGCVADTVKAITLSSKPVAAFGATGTFCPGSNFTFSDSSSIETGTIVEWTWNFGNGNTFNSTTNIAPPVQTYPAPGVYTVTLEVKSNTGCKSVLATKLITIHSLPVVDFNLPGVCLPSGVAQFQNLTTTPGGGANSYVWNFGDGGTSTAINPVHTYTAPGPYSVQLTATSAFGCKKDSTKTFTNIFAQPIANFTTTPAEICVKDSFSLSDASTTANSSVAEWFWDFGDGTSSNLQHPVKKYVTAGNYPVKLYIKSAAGCESAVFEKLLIVNALPTPAFVVSPPVCEAKEVTILNQSQANSGTISSYYWNLGDGTTSTTSASSFTHTYALGSYSIKLSLVNSKGCKSDTLVKTVEVNALPVVNFGLPIVCLSDAFAQFTDSSQISDGSAGAFTYAWNFGDPNASAANPNTSNVKNPQHKYSAAQVYNVSLTVTSNKGCTATLSKQFTVNGAVPDARFEVLNSNSLCSNKEVQIRNTSVVDFGAISRVEIIWDNANTPTVMQVDDAPSFNKVYSHNYPSLQVTRTYQVKLRAFSGGTCVDEEIKTITVNASPKVSFATIPGICLDANPRQLDIPANGGVVGTGAFSGNGITAAGIFTPTITGAGNSTIRYTYVSDKGCRDSSTATITAWPSPTAFWKTSTTTCVADAITFADSSVANFGNITQWNWNFDGIVVPKTSADPFGFTFNSTGTYPVQLQVITDSGCRAEYVQQVTVHPKPQVGFSLPVVCLPAGKAQFFDQTTIAGGAPSVFTYHWQFGNPLNATPSTLKDPIHYYSSTGPFTVKLKATSVHGCTDSLSQQLNSVYPQPKADFTFTPIDTCVGGTFWFIDNSDGRTSAISTWNWKFGNGSTASVPDPSHRYAGAGRFNVSLFITNQQGCVSDTAVRSVTVHPFPVVNAGPDLFVLEGDDLVIQPQVTGNILSYLWTPSTYLINDTVKNAVTRPLRDIAYKLTVTGAGGCKADDEVFVKLLKALRIPSAFSPNADGINDTWIIEHLETYPGATVEVFDRYGRQVFMSYGYKKPWDGSFNNNALPVGTYYYIIDPKNGRQRYTGSVTLLK
ncbi:PKD domain-containing protein [Aridibaculum aurantiacum]|uniref:PKD domain-containing protein n=1 Tax=Aridibaculum aurantiacum TaxID=2810307 RepID=UPI001A95CB82|nr:PKD domain-containing protein [Aridibaculum aurantiacum]